MIVDNFDLIKEMINCEEGEFYLLQIIHRSKDGLTKFDKDSEKQHFSNKTLKSYYVTSPDYLDKKKDEIVELCHTFNARAYFNPNKKSYRQISLKCLSELAKMVSCEEYRGVRSLVDSACGQTGSVGEKYWIVDIDTKDENEIETIKNIIESCEPLDVKKVVWIVPTLHGVHFITRSFNKKKFRDLYNQSLDMHDNNPTLLYFKEPEL